MKRILPVLICALALAGCGSSDNTAQVDMNNGAITSASSRLTLGVNSYLWHASLDTMSFMPLVSADPFGGVIITDWYVAPTAPDERLKVTIYISDRALRAALNGRGHAAAPIDRAGQLDAGSAVIDQAPVINLDGVAVGAVALAGLGDDQNGPQSVEACLCPRGGRRRAEKRGRDGQEKVRAYQ